MTDGKRRIVVPRAWRGGAFDRCQAGGMIARKIMKLSNVVQQAAPGNVSARELPKRCRIVRTKLTRDLLWRHQGPFAGAACKHAISPGKRRV
jgi:hypothetical protein